MKNRKIVFANQKGGVGKSTLCILFAIYTLYSLRQLSRLEEATGMRY